MYRHPPNTTLFPYTTLFLSLDSGLGGLECVLPVLLVASHDEFDGGRVHAGDRQQCDHQQQQQGDHQRRATLPATALGLDRKSTRLNSSHLVISYAVFCLKKK